MRGVWAGVAWLVACSPGGGPEHEPDAPADPPPVVDTPPADDPWWSEVQQRITDGEYQLRTLDDGRFRFTNRASELRAFVDDAGTAIIARSANADAPDWTLRVRTAAVGRGSALSPVQEGPARPGACVGALMDELGECIRRAERDAGAGVLAWWENTSAGLKQGWDHRSAGGRRSVDRAGVGRRLPVRAGRRRGRRRAGERSRAHGARRDRGLGRPGS